MVSDVNVGVRRGGFKWCSVTGYRYEVLTERKTTWHPRNGIRPVSASLYSVITVSTTPHSLAAHVSHTYSWIYTHAIVERLRVFAIQRCVLVVLVQVSCRLTSNPLCAGCLRHPATLVATSLSARPCGHSARGRGWMEQIRAKVTASHLLQGYWQPSVKTASCTKCLSLY